MNRKVLPINESQQRIMIYSQVIKPTTIFQEANTCDDNDSCDNVCFDKAAPVYKNALKKSGFN